MSAVKLRVLVVEDEPDMAMGLRDNLEFEGYDVTTVPSGEEAVQAARSTRFACILLDVMLPRIDGFETCSRLRGLGVRAPIVTLTARGQEIDKVRGLELGADDYVTKPFGLRELIARIRAVIRRSDAAPPPPAEEVQIGAALIHFASGRVVRGRREFTLGHYECEVLKMLLRVEGAVVERRALLSEIWGVENEPLNRSVDNHVVSLRRKIEEDPSHPRHILTVHGFGYKLVR